MKILKCLLVSAILFFMLVNLQAGETRIHTLGYEANFYVQDDNNIWYFPSTLPNHRSLVIAESEYPYGELWSGGVHVPVNQNLTLAVYLMNSTQFITYSDTKFRVPLYNIPVRTEWYPGMDTDEASHQFTVIGGLRMNNMDFGLQVTSYNSKLTYLDPDDTDNNFEDNLSTISAAGGVSFKANERTRFDGTIFYEMSSFKHLEYANYAYGDTAQWKQPYGYSTYGVGARMFYVLNPKAILVPFLSYMSGGEGYQWLVESLTTTGNISTYKDKSTLYILGIAADLIPYTNNLVTLAAGFFNWTETYEMTLLSGTPPVSSKMTYRALPFLSIGLESRVARWLDVRFSFYELLETRIEENPVTETILDKGRLTGSTYSANFGLAFHVGRFDIDTLIDMDGGADFLHNGPYILSGKTYNGLFSKISVKYNFR